MQMPVVILGAASLILGIVALAFPLPASISVVLFTGWAFTVVGALQMYSAFRERRLMTEGLWGLFPLVLGILLIARPLDGVIALTVVVGSVFAVSGLFRLAMGLKLGHRFRWLVVISGGLSLLFGLVVLLGLQDMAPVTLGLMLAIELILIGTVLIVVGMARR